MKTYLLESYRLKPNLLQNSERKKPTAKTLFAS